MKLLFATTLTTITCALFPVTTFAGPSDLEITQENEISINDDIQAQTERYRYNFGQVRVNRSAVASFSLRNRGSFPIYINDIDIEGDGFRKNDNCPRILTRGDSCRVRVRFQPRDTGRYEGRLDIELTPSEDIRVDLRGRGVRGGRGGGDWD